MKFAITGPSHITVLQTRFVADRVRFVLDDSEPAASEFTSGVALGVDTVGLEAAAKAKVPLLRLTIPRISENGAVRALPCNSDLIRKAWEATQGGDLRWRLAPAKAGATVSEGYLLRDDSTISHAQVLLAFPRSTKEEQRSGTWATVRRARTAGIEIRSFPLDGSTPWVTPAALSLFDPL
jgi:hypothetical protein